MTPTFLRGVLKETRHNLEASVVEVVVVLKDSIHAYTDVLMFVHNDIQKSGNKEEVWRSN